MAFSSNFNLDKTVASPLATAFALNCNASAPVCNVPCNNITEQNYTAPLHKFRVLVQLFLMLCAVFLRIKKRRWRQKLRGTIIKRDFSFIADGSKFTQELSDFLKDASGYATRYHEQHSELLWGG